MDTQLLKLSSSAFPLATKAAALPTQPLNFPSSSQPKFPLFPSSLRTQSRSHATATGKNDGAFNEAAYEAERLSLDAAARDTMAQKSVVEAQDSDDPKAWKWVIRKRVWDLMEALNIAQFPRPVHHRIPNFIGANIAANKEEGLLQLSESDVFKEAKCVKVNIRTQ